MKEAAAKHKAKKINLGRSKATFCWGRPKRISTKLSLQKL